MPKNTKRDAWMAANKPSKAEINACIARAEHVLQALLDSGLSIVELDGKLALAPTTEIRAVLAGAVAAPNRPSMPFGARIKAARESRGVTQVALSARLGVTQPSITDYEQSTNVSENTLRKVAEALGMSVTDLVVGW